MPTASKNSLQARRAAAARERRVESLGEVADRSRASSPSGAAAGSREGYPNSSAAPCSFSLVAMTTAREPAQAPARVAWYREVTSHSPLGHPSRTCAKTGHESSASLRSQRERSLSGRRWKRSRSAPGRARASCASQIRSRAGRRSSGRERGAHRWPARVVEIEDGGQPARGGGRRAMGLEEKVSQVGGGPHASGGTRGG